MSPRKHLPHRRTLVGTAVAVAAAAALAAGCGDDLDGTADTPAVETTAPTIDPGDPETSTTDPTTTHYGPFDQGPIGAPLPTRDVHATDTPSRHR
ncbi:hypothetical protein C8K36_1011425 [Rhodococcus sp. OK519]|uniref:hypothetical protein n=1 Tax=Rhodococcus sp. OK519 TaxID=2135729 RepID=UPI000D379731|nr:hypothetical protein C8K36_1011425 [Rhodococcus sp. OK519]